MQTLSAVLHSIQALDVPLGGAVRPGCILSHVTRLQRVSKHPLLQDRFANLTTYSVEKMSSKTESFLLTVAQRNAQSCCLSQPKPCTGLQVQG